MLLLLLLLLIIIIMYTYVYIYIYTHMYMIMCSSMLRSLLLLVIDSRIDRNQTGRTWEKGSTLGEQWREPYLLRCVYDIRGRVLSCGTWGHGGFTGNIHATQWGVWTTLKLHNSKITIRCHGARRQGYSTAFSPRQGAA